MAQRQQWRKISGVGDAIERTKIIQQDSLEEQSSLSCGIMECLLHNEKASPETQYGSQHVNSQELVPQLATLWLFITCKFSNSKSVSTPMLLHGCTTEGHKHEMMFSVLGWLSHWCSLRCHAVLWERLLSGSFNITSLLWWTGNYWTTLIWRKMTWWWNLLSYSYWYTSHLARLSIIMLLCQSSEVVSRKKGENKLYVTEEQDSEIDWTQWKLPAILFTFSTDPASCHSCSLSFTWSEPHGHLKLDYLNSFGIFKIGLRTTFSDWTLYLLMQWLLVTVGWFVWGKLFMLLFNKFFIFMGIFLEKYSLNV